MLRHDVEVPDKHMYMYYLYTVYRTIVLCTLQFGDTDSTMINNSKNISLL